MLIQKSERAINEVSGITAEQKQRIMDFLQGAVYCWCKNRKDEWFAAKDLLGGDNYFWQGTPMIVLYEKSGDEEQAAKDAGWLLKRVLDDDKRRFEEGKQEGVGRFPVKKYRWNGEEVNS